MTLRISTPSQEGVYQGSKYLKYHVLCDKEELERLFEALGDFFILPLTGITDGNPIEKGHFLKEYGKWIAGLQQGSLPSDAELKKILSAAFTTELDALWKQEVAPNRYIIKMAKPTLQLQAHFFTYSAIDGVFRPMTMGQGSIFWGLQFSYPQIYQEPKTMGLFETEDFGLFNVVKRWVRDETRATPFLVDGKKINVPIRLGKQCFSWIHLHPQLKTIGVYAN